MAAQSCWKRRGGRVAVALLLSLAALALVDSTSIGTLVLPLWLMLAPGRVRGGRVLLFLGSVAGAYLVLGVALALGAAQLLDPVSAALDLTGERGTGAGKELRRAARGARRPGRLARWRERVRGDADGGGGAVVGLAAVAVGVEAASMVPYLAAIALLATSGLGPVPTVAVLAGYCLVMVLPALVLLALRAALHDRLTPALARVEAWLSRTSGEAVAWVLFLLGLFLVGDALPLS